VSRFHQAVGRSASRFAPFGGIRSPVFVDEVAASFVFRVGHPFEILKLVIEFGAVFVVGL